MRVILDKKVEAKGDKSVQHGIEQKTELAKKTGADGISKSAKRVIKTAENIHETKQDMRQIRDIAKQNGKKREIKSGFTPKADKPDLTKPQYKEAAARSKKRVIYPQQTKQEGGVKHYKVLKNGAASKEKLQKIKPKTLQNAVKVDTSRLHFRRISAERLKKLKLAKRKKYDTLMKDKWYNKSIDLHTGGFKEIGAGIKTTGVIFRPVTKRLRRITDKVVSSIDNDGVQFAKKTYDVSKSAVDAGGTALKTSAKGVKRTARTLTKVIDPRERRKLKKAVHRQVKQLKRDVKTAQKVAKKTAQAAKKAAKASAKAAKKGADAAAKAAKAVAKGIAKVVSYIVSTMPWSLIIIGIIILVLLIALAFAGVLSGAGGSAGGAGGWAIDDSEPMEEEEIYENVEKFRKQSKEVCDSNVKNSLHSEVNGFCISTDPQRIISYYDSSTSVTYYPATGGKEPVKTNITNYLDTSMTSDKYSEFLAALFVLETREKQQADGVDDATIYDFDFTKADFEEFIGTVDGNSCRFGSTFIIKTTVETTGEKCPGENCKTEYRSGCKCSSRTDPDTGKVTEYCGGHPYCPANHTKLTVNLKTVEDYYGKPVSEIYGFSENEMARYEAAKAFIAALMKDKEEGII